MKYVYLCFQLLSFMIWRCSFWSIDVRVSEELAASVCRVEEGYDAGSFAEIWVPVYQTMWGQILERTTLTGAALRIQNTYFFP
jgi:hypothetical protein